METEVSLINSKLTLTFSINPPHSITYQLRYFGLLEINNPKGYLYEGSVNNIKIVETLNFLEKKGIKYNLDNKISEYLKNLKNEEKNKKKHEEFLISIKNNPDKNDFNQFVSSLDNLLLKRDLADHQLRTLHHLYNSNSAAIFSVPGSGKTSVVLAFYEKLKLENKVDHIFIIGPVNCFVSWEREFLLNINRKLELKVLGGGNTPEDRKIFYEKKLKKELVMAHFSTITNDLDYLKYFFKHNRFLLVIDEAHNIKKIDGAWSNAALHLSECVDYKIVLTGTPLPNDLRDIYNYLDFLYGENFIFSKRDRMKIDVLLNKDKKNEAIEFVREKINPFYTRVTKKELNLSKPIFNTPILIDMNPIEEEIYTAIQTKIRNYGKKSFLNNYEFIQKICRARIIRLKQAASYIKNLDSAMTEEYLDVDEKIFEDSQIKNLVLNYDNLEKPAKLTKLKSMVLELKEKNKKVLIWSTHLKTIDLILNSLRTEGINTKKITGEVNRDIEEKKNIMDQFNDPNSNLDALVALPQACSESISLHKACQNAIYYDLNYNAAEFLQSLDRIHRVGGSEILPVYYNFLHYKNTVDTKVYDRVFKKADRQMQIIENDNLTFDLSDEDENWETLYNDLSL